MQTPKQKILLTGASGFIGTNFITQLHKKYDITALVRKNSDVSKIEKYCKIYRYNEDSLYHCESSEATSAHTKSLARESQLDSKDIATRESHKVDSKNATICDTKLTMTESSDISHSPNTTNHGYSQTNRNTMAKESTMQSQANLSLDSLTTLFETQKFDGILHLATLYLSNHKAQDVLNLISSNITFGTLLLESMRVNPPKFFINTMSAFEFANDENYNPFNLYAATKHAFYDITKYYTKILPTIFSHLLLYDSYGSNDTRQKIFNLWKKCASSNEALEMSEGEQELDITHVDDIVRAYDALITLHNEEKVLNNRIYNLENERHSLKQLASLFEKYTQTKLSIKWGAKPYRDGEIMQPVSRKTSAFLHEIPSFKLKVSLEDGLKNI